MYAIRVVRSGRLPGPVLSVKGRRVLGGCGNRENDDDDDDVEPTSSFLLFTRFLFLSKVDGVAKTPEYDKSASEPPKGDLEKDIFQEDLCGE